MQKRICIFVLASLLVGFFTHLNAQESKQDSRTSIKSGIIKYKDIRMVNGKKLGEETDAALYFDAYGKYEFFEEYAPVSINGKKLNKHIMRKLEDGVFYDYDLATGSLKQISPQENGALKGISILTKAELEHMKATKTGEEKILGYSCEIWEFAYGKMWLYQNILVKFKGGAMMFEIIKEPVSIELNVPIDKTKLQKIEKEIVHTKSLGE